MQSCADLWCHLIDYYLAHHPDSMPDRVPRSFNALAVGTRAFIAGYMEGVQTSIEALRSLPRLAARDSMFLLGLEYLATQEAKTPREAESEMPE